MSFVVTATRRDGFRHDGLRRDGFRHDGLCRRHVVEVQRETDGASRDGGRRRGHDGAETEEGDGRRARQADRHGALQGHRRVDRHNGT